MTARGVPTRRPAEPRLAPLGARREKRCGSSRCSRGHRRARPEITRRAARLARFGIDAPPPAGDVLPAAEPAMRAALVADAGARRWRARGRGGDDFEGEEARKGEEETTRATNKNKAVRA